MFCSHQVPTLSVENLGGARAEASAKFSYGKPCRKNMQKFSVVEWKYLEELFVEFFFFFFAITKCAICKTNHANFSPVKWEFLQNYLYWIENICETLCCKILQERSCKISHCHVRIFIQQCIEIFEGRKIFARQYMHNFALANWENLQSSIYWDFWRQRDLQNVTVGKHEVLQEITCKILDWPSVKKLAQRNLCAGQRQSEAGMI